MEFRGEHGVYVLGDARELIKTVPSGSVDCVLTDPPWGVGFDEYDNFDAFLDVIPELYRVMKENSWLAFFTTPKRIYDFTPLLRYFKYVWMIPYLLKTGATARTPLGNQVTYSIVMVFAKGRPKVRMKRGDLIFADELPIGVETPNERQFKPTYAISALVSMFTSEGDLILDPFAGYGSIPLVCELFKRKWIAFEIDPLKFQIARKIVLDRKLYNIKRLKGELKIEVVKTLEDFRS
jgi:DNA modification methylase